MNRRQWLQSSVGALFVATSPAIVRAQAVSARQYHVQPEDSHLHIYLTKIWNAVRDETAGRLAVTVHARNNGLTIGDAEILKLVQAGELEFFTLNGSFLSRLHPAADIQSVPFAFKDSAQIATLNDGAFGDFLRGELSGRGVQLIPFGGMESGFKQITSIDKPIRTVEDLRGFKMRVPNGKLFVDFYKALGAEPKIIDFNRLFAALKAGEVDGQENPLVVAQDNKLYEVCRHISLTSHQWAGFNMLSSQTFWENLPEEVRGVVVHNTRRFVPEQRLAVQAINARTLKALEERGMIVNETDVSGMRRALVAAGFYANLREVCGAKAWAMMEAETGAVG